MAARDKIRERVQPLLEPGEQVQAVIPCQTGPSPWFSALSWLIVLFGAKYWIIAATDRNLVVCKASAFMPFKPKGVDRRLPRATQIGPVSGLWAKSEVLGTTTYINKRFHRDVEAADAALGSAGGVGTQTAASQPAGWYPDPNGGGQRYWDGQAWTEHTSA